jgi:long-subunit acyl-CoA synthetase (AMP-forming)
MKPIAAQTPQAYFKELSLLGQKWGVEFPLRGDKAGFAFPLLEGAEKLLAGGPGPGPEAAGAFLRLTSRPEFLRDLGSPERLARWAETCFALIRRINYSLRDLFEDRAGEAPGRIFIQDMSISSGRNWTYETVSRHVRNMAGALFALADGDGAVPRVAIFAENHAQGAFVDLACLFHDILVSPLNPHFDPGNVVQIFDALGINLAIADDAARVSILREARRLTARPFRIVVTNPDLKAETGADVFLDEFARGLDVRDIDARLEKRRRFRLDEVATVMFTSGSTGRPKGVSFSPYNLMAKRFARAAALPEVGRDEVFLSFLPLYHTFGRYLELQGTIFWRGTYVLAGNPSAETLFSLFPRIRPTGFISVPVRWVQLHEKCLEAVDAAAPGTKDRDAVRQVVGPRLSWGLSAAGHLDARVFRFFESHGIGISSGFGMTEATGGITMTPPGRYIDESQGFPLPGLTARLLDSGELQVSGHYVARYLADKGPGDFIDFPSDPKTDYWLSTGDIFRRRTEGDYQIVDRIKDIYKNNRGQTIAPRKVEDKFLGVPGIKRTFLVGDGRPHNVLFIIPDYEDRVLADALSPENAREYYRRIVTAANLGLAPYERVVNFALLPRDFDPSLGEITPKGSFNRKKITAAFGAEIEALYSRNAVELRVKNEQVRIPLWVFRDLGILDDEIISGKAELRDVNRGRSLVLERGREVGFWRIGDLEYEIPGGTIDLGLFARQPLLWAGNPSLAAFAPCKEGWDLPLEPATGRLALPPRKKTNSSSRTAGPSLPAVREERLKRLHELLATVLFAAEIPPDEAMIELERLFNTSDLIRGRLRALARHPLEKIRCWAYRLLFLDEPNVDYSRLLPAFVESGLSFLNRDSIDEIVSSPMGQGRFDALRKRMRAYRETMSWPAGAVTRRQFERIFRLFVDLARRQPDYYGPVRAEFSSWILLRKDSVLAASAEKHLIRLNGDFRRRFRRSSCQTGAGVRTPALDPMFDDSLDPGEAVRVGKILADPSFLAESVRLTYKDADFDPRTSAVEGLWVSRIYNAPRRSTYRIGINTNDRRHFDLKLVLPDGRQDKAEREANLWSAVLADYPEGDRVLPPLGSMRTDSGAVSWRHIGDLTVWEKIRDFAGRRTVDSPLPVPSVWRKLFIEALAAIFRAWSMSGFRMIPGRVSPVNIIVPELDFQDDTVLASLDGCRESAGPISLVRPMVDNFFRRAAAHYPWCLDHLDLDWIFDAAYDALGRERAAGFFAELQAALDAAPVPSLPGQDLAVRLRRYRAEFDRTYFLPMPAQNAVDAYREWLSADPLAPSRDRERKVLDLHRRYRLERFPEIVRYYLYRHTYFSGRNERLETVFDRLLARMNEHPEDPAVQRIELSDLQSALRDERDRRVYSRMVFPRLEPDRKLDVVALGEEGSRRVVIQSTLTDRRGRNYVFGETVDPAEIGQIYRLLFKANYPKLVSQQDLHFVLKDAQDRIVGGLCYRRMSGTVAFIDSIVVTSNLKASGLGGAAVDDFCARMAGQGVRIVMTHLYLPGFFIRRGFKLDKRWGALVKSM